MARQVLPWVGAAVGFFAGGNWQLGFAIGSLIGNAVDPQTIRGPSIGEGQNNTASEGGYRPIVLGKGAVGVCMIHQGPTIKRTIRERQSKGGGPVTEQERIYRTMAFALGEAADPDQGVLLLRLWVDNKLRYDVTPTSQIEAESVEFAEQFTFYPGNDTQDPDPDLEAMPEEWGGGAGNVPAYRGGAPYIVFPEWDVTDSGGRAPMIKAELATLFTGGEVTMALAVGFASSPVNRQVILRSPDGPTWLTATDPVSPSISVTNISPVGDRFYLWDLIDVYHVDGLGQNLTKLSDTMASVGGQHQSYTRTDQLLIPGGFQNGVYEVDIEGDALIQTGGVVANNIATREDMSIAVSLYEPVCRLRLAGSGAWSEGGEPTVYQSSNKYISCSATRFAIGGQSSNVSPKPHISTSPTGTIWTGATFSASAGESVRYVVPGQEGRWVALVDNGEIWWTDDDWQSASQSSTTLPQLPTGLAWNGELFIAACGPSGDASIWTSPDGDTWTQRSQTLTSISLLSARPPRPSEAQAEKITLESVFDFVHSRVDIPSNKYDASTLTQLLEGVVFAEGYTGADALRAGMGWYQVDAGEYDAGSGYQINYVNRGGTALFTLTDDDIIDGPEDWEREDSYERPRVLHVAYPNPVADYGAPVIPIKRTSHDVLVVGERSVSIPFVTSDQNEVARRGDVAMTVIYTEIAGTVEVILPISWLELAPTDCIGYSIRGRTRRLRMTNWRFQPDGTISTEWIADRQSAYTSNLTALPPVPSTPPPPSIVGPTVSAVLDIPSLVDSLDTLHLVVAASGQTPGWYGASHQRQAPGDPDFITAVQFTTPTTIMGTLDDDVSDASEHFTDTTNVVRVSLYSDDELLTFTQEQFLSENGAFALEWEDSSGRHWEILQYRDAVKVGEQTWELTTLARGRLNTETAEHPAGSLFVLLDAGIRAINMQSAWLDEDITHRAVSYGQNPDQATTYTEEYTGQSQREWPVAHLFASLNGDTLEAAWVPRHRFGTDDNPVRSVNWTGYRVTATDGSNTLTADTTGEGHSFDVTGWSTPITVSVSQLNRLTGEGPAVIEVVA